MVVDDPPGQFPETPEDQGAVVVADADKIVRVQVGGDADDDTSYRVRPSFIAGYMAGTANEPAYPLLLTTHGVPLWLLKVGFGHSEMYWCLLIERLGRSSLVGATVGDPAHLPEHLAADEHHVAWAGQKVFVALTVGDDAILGVVLTDSADDDHLCEAYGQIAAKARGLAPDYAPRTINIDGWAATRNAFASCTGS